jgi:beta-glucosidase
LYIRDLVASTTRPVRELKGFTRVDLKAGQTKEVEFVLTPDDLSFCRKDMVWGTEPGDFSVWIGDSCEAELEGKFTIK